MDDDEQDTDLPMLAFHNEDFVAIKMLGKAVTHLLERPSLDEDDARLLRTLRFGLERLPFQTPGMGVLLILKAEAGGESEWMEIRLDEDEFSMGRGVWTQGDAHSETIFEVSESFRDGSLYPGFFFAQEFRDTARDPERIIQVEETTLDPFDGWDMQRPDQGGWEDCEMDFW